MAIDLKSGTNAGKSETSPEICKNAGSKLAGRFDKIRLYLTAADWNM